MYVLSEGNQDLPPTPSPFPRPRLGKTGRDYKPKRDMKGFCQKCQVYQPNLEGYCEECLNIILGWKITKVVGGWKV